jgi:hypothetical protein
MKNFNWFRLLQVLCGGLGQWAVIITGFVFLVKSITAFSAFHVAMVLLCVVGFVLVVILQNVFYACAEGHEILIQLRKFGDK